MTISVIICTRNRGALVEATLHSILQGMRLPDEVLVIDQSEGLETKNLVDAMGKCACPIRYRATETRGLSRARNVGLEESQGELIVFTDDDVVVYADWLEQIAAEFDAYPHLAFLFGTVLPPDSYDWRTEFVPYCRVKTRRSVRWYQKEVFGGMGANMALRRATVERAGPFDPAVGPGNETTGDDFEYAIRCLCQRPPLEMHLLAEACVIHHAGARTGGEYKRFVHQMNGTGMGLFWAHLLFEGDPRRAASALLGLVRPLAGFAAEIAHGRRPSGLRTYAYSLKGFALGARRALAKRSMST